MPSSAWSAFVPLGGEIIAAPGAISPKPNTAPTVYGWGLDNQLWRTTWSSGKWQGWVPHHPSNPLELTSEPATCSVGSGHEQVFVRGPDWAVWTTEWKGFLTWTDWKSLGGKVKGAPAAISRSPEVKNVYVRGMDDALWQNSWFGGNWSGWKPHNDGGVFSSEPAVASSGPFHEQVFVRGLDGAVWTKEWTASNGWTGWDSLGGVIQGAPAAVSRAPGLINVYVRGMDDRLWQKGKAGGVWGDWVQHPDGFPLTSRPSVYSYGEHHEQVFVRGRDGGVWMKRWAREVVNRIRVHLVDFAIGSVFVNDSNSMFGQVGAMSQIFDSRVFALGHDPFWIEPASYTKLDVANYHVVEVGECKGTPTDEQKKLFSNYRFGAAGNEVVIYNVIGTNPVLNGCATHPAGLPGAVVTAAASPWTMAHELGHVLRLKHVNDSTRLMFDGGTWNITDPPPELTPEERQIIKKSGLVLN